jgi:hypothetical protein
MPRRQHLIEEVGKLDCMIAAVKSELESERAAGAQADDLLREMEDALTDLRLARGVRLMWLNAYGESIPTGAQRRNTGGALDTAGWPRTGQRVA